MKNKPGYLNDYQRTHRRHPIKEHVLGRAKITVVAIPLRPFDEALDQDTFIAICRGELKSFAAQVEVQFDGVVLTSEWLHGCVYEEYKDFLNSGYVMDMVHDAVAASRKTLKARAIAKLTA